MVDTPQTDIVGVLTRAPSAGGKSRLFDELGVALDAELLIALLLDTIDSLAVVPARRIAIVEPASACDEVRALVPPDVGVMAQRGSTLGERMRLAMTDLFAAGAARVALVGSDLPAIPPRAVVEALALLARDRESIAIGPAADGGYYLVAAADVPDIFSGIAWSSPRVLEQTQRAAVAARRRIVLVDSAADIDTVDDLRALAATSGPSARRTIAWARRHGLGETAAGN